MECADAGAKRARYKELWVSAQSRFSRDRGLEREEISLSSHAAPAFSSSMIFSDLPAPAEASNNTTTGATASRRRETGYHPGSSPRASFSGSCFSDLIDQEVLRLAMMLAARRWVPVTISRYSASKSTAPSAAVASLSVEARSNAYPASARKPYCRRAAGD